LKFAERWFVMAGVAVLGCVAVAGFALAVYAALLFHDLPDAAQLADYRPPTATRVFSWDGTLIGEFSKERRIFTPYDEIPPVVVEAFLAAEDRNFFQHGGIDVGGMGRAFGKNALNLLRGRRLEGGSTITQQVAKNVLLTPEQNLGRKLKEAILARRLEAVLDKKQILELYLNEIFLGYRSYGVSAAAFNYFGKPLNQLDLAQAAFLAALPKGPNNYHPIKHKDLAIARRNWILGQMLEKHWITAEQARAAAAEDLVVQPAPERAKYKDADFFVAEVRQRVQRMVPGVDEGGYYLRTTLDSHLQTYAQNALMKGLEAYDRRHGWRGAWGNVPVDAGWELKAELKSPPAEHPTWKVALVDEVGGDAHVLIAGHGAGRLDAKDVAWAKNGKGLHAGDLVFVEPLGGGVYGLRQVPIVNGALVAMDPQTGRVLAMVGGYSFSLSKFNRATQAMRQPGSAFKPFVYATAMENNQFTPASIILDAPISLIGANGSVWSPENYEKDSLGPVPIRKGLELSRNQMTVRLAQQVGMRRIIANAEKFGVVDNMQPVLAMALGAGETTPFRLTAAYSIFANGGRRITPHLIEVVQNREGEAIYKADPRRCAGCDESGDPAPLSPLGDQVLDPITSYEITSMLEGVVQRGTAYQARVLGRPIAGKTGTTNEYRSAWFVGYSPSLVVGVFVGFDDNRSLGEHETGAVAAVPIFIDFMQQALKGKPVEDFAKPKDAVFRTVHGIEEAFHPGFEPKLETVSNPGQGGAAVPLAPGAPFPGPFQPAAVTPPQAPAAPPKKKVPEDLNGLY
jgi:penicillin-binding protein 1A